MECSRCSCTHARSRTPAACNPHSANCYSLTPPKRRLRYGLITRTEPRPSGVLRDRQDTDATRGVDAQPWVHPDLVRV